MVVPSRVVSLPLDGECHAYELVGGVFGKAMISPTADTFSHALRFYTFPNGGDQREEAHTLLHNDVGLALRDFALDPYQDLLVLVQIEQNDSRWV